MLVNNFDPYIFRFQCSFFVIHKMLSYFGFNIESGTETPSITKAICIEFPHILYYNFLCLLLSYYLKAVFSLSRSSPLLYTSLWMSVMCVCLFVCLFYFVSVCLFVSFSFCLFIILSLFIFSLLLFFVFDV